LPIEDQELVLVTAPAGPFVGRTSITPGDLAGHRLIVSQRGSLMRALVDDVMSSGVSAKIVAEVAHRTSILPLLLAGVGDAVLPAGWTGIARRAGCDVVAITPPSYLRVALVYRGTSLTPSATAFLECAKRYAAQQISAETSSERPRNAPGKVRVRSPRRCHRALRSSDT
jgi:hypothetical protein